MGYHHRATGYIYKYNIYIYVFIYNQNGDLFWNVLDYLDDLMVQSVVKGSKKKMQVTLKFQGPAKTHGDVQDGQW
jgi:hypothetical protein